MKIHRSKAILISLAIVFLLIIIPFIFYTEYISANYEIARLSNLFVGYPLNDEILVSEIIPFGIHRIFVCGIITSRGYNYLSITLHSKDEHRYYGKVTSDTPYEKGNFCNEIAFVASTPLSRGLYKIIVVDQHKRVGELIFEVK